MCISLGQPFCALQADFDFICKITDDLAVFCNLGPRCCVRAASEPLKRRMSQGKILAQVAKARVSEIESPADHGPVREILDDEGKF